MKPSNKNCCVVNCFSKAGREKHLSFHKFPKAGESKVVVKTAYGSVEKIDRRKAWIKAIKTDKPISDHMTVCSAHFRKEDFFPDLLYVSSKRKVLLKTAVPSQNLPVTSFSAATKYRKPRKIIERYVQAEVQPDENVAESQEDEMIIDYEENVYEPQKKDVAVQVDEYSFTEPFVSLLDSDKKLNTMTGVKTGNLLDAIVTSVEKLDQSKRLRRFSVRERVILTLIKLKCNLLFAVLAILFRTTSATCKTIFAETIPLLPTVMSSVIIFPSKDEITNNLPHCFKGFENVRVVLDCTEIPIQLKKCLHCRLISYSHYKGKQTVKFMTGVSPAGLITFVSKAYGGRTSDKAIFEQSQLIKLLEPGLDALMVDKGFLIDNIAAENFIKIIRPPFLKKKTQFNSTEAHITRKIAAARVHIERVNQRIKLFAILNYSLNSNLLPFVDQIFITICGLVNLSPPVLDDNKFM